MTRAVSLALALTLSSAPIGNILCAAWCDARFSSSGSASDVCHGELAHTPFAVVAGSDACEAFASTPFLREDTRRLARDTVSIDVALLPVVLTVHDPGVKSGAPAGTQHLTPTHAQTLVLRV
jgi:hypothetical protein